MTGTICLGAVVLLIVVIVAVGLLPAPKIF